MRICSPTDSGWVEIDAIVALLILSVAAASVSGAVRAAASAAERVAASASAALDLESDNAERAVVSASR